MSTVAFSQCPECGAEFSFSDIAILGEQLFAQGYDSSAKCPHCGIEWQWENGGLSGEPNAEKARLSRALEQIEKLKARLVQQSFSWPEKRGKRTHVICACGCGESFWTTRPDKYYLNNAHRSRGYRRGIVVDTRKRHSVLTRESTETQERM